MRIGPTPGDRFVKVFFYGLFMDQGLLATKGIKPAQINTGFVDGYQLRIGERATLVRRCNGRAYGVIMDMTPDETAVLYAGNSVSDYVPEPVTVELVDGSRVDATCYNLPETNITGTNRKYAESLLQLASRLGLPDSYLEEIRRATNGQ